MRQLFPMFSGAAPAAPAQLPLYRDVAMDYGKGVPLFSGGEPVLVTGLEAVISWAWRALKTTRYMWSCYTWDYGCELEALVGQPYRQDTRRSEAVRYVEEALEVCPYITSVQVQVEVFAGSTLTMSVRVHTVYGDARLPELGAWGIAEQAEEVVSEDV